MPTISVIIPAYNSERTIVDTIVSVQQQTFSDFEIIVINDGSTDGTLKLLDELKDSRIKVFSYENGGLSVARNRGISHAKGDFIAFLDADDLWTADKLELQLEALQKNPEAGVAYSWTYFMDEQTGNCHLDRPIFFQGKVLANLLTWNFIASGSNPLIRKQAIESVGEFEPSVSGAADWDYWLRLAAKWSFVVVSKPQIFYRQSSNSMSSKVEFMEDCQFQVLERAFQSGSPEIQILKNYSLAYVYRYSCKLCLTRITGDEGVEKASQKLGKAIQLYPKILLEKETQKLIIKLLLKKILVENISAYLLQIISKIRVAHVQKLNIHEKRIG
ncbi:MAG: glycosyltransferase [Nostoc sp. DedQUE04]|uniref:glycosyltransferase family 2 protein n=1 Tax=unclassified Nostoc TaxID=2593658 RepID=UPI002AD4C824|nr:MULTISPECIES: glycosyltransferase [unclassified Nostoc]MDZ8128203.1 glycosyltransferase [Nostoc sp. DedQUE07]MDZ8137918.1 glycosyltransferase [Nostoc sp. DedQUE04]